eukprot:jgi/Undpi1/7014/HiC_scaffold_21.g09488.m1
MRAITTTTEPAAMSSIYRASPSKRTKASAGGGSAHSAGGGGSSGVWTLVGQERESASATGNTDWPCPRKGCYGFLVARTRKNSNSQYAVCDTRRGDDPSTCQAFYNLNKKHWGSADNPRVCDWCDADTCDSPSIGVLNEGAESSTKPWSNYHTVWKLCLGARSLNKLKFAWVVPEGSPVIGKSLGKFAGLTDGRLVEVETCLQGAATKDEVALKANASRMEEELRGLRADGALMARQSSLSSLESMVSSLSREHDKTRKTSDLSARFVDWFSSRGQAYEHNLAAVETHIENLATRSVGARASPALASRVSGSGSSRRVSMGGRTGVGVPYGGGIRFTPA